MRQEAAKKPPKEDQGVSGRKARFDWLLSNSDLFYGTLTQAQLIHALGFKDNTLISETSVRRWLNVERVSHEKIQAFRMGLESYILDRGRSGLDRSYVQICVNYLFDDNATERPPRIPLWHQMQNAPVEPERTTAGSSSPGVPELTALLQQLICNQGKSPEPDERLAVLEKERSSPRLQDDSYNPRTVLNIACQLSYSEPLLQVIKRESPRMLIESFFGRLFEVKQAGEVQDLARAIAYVEHRFKEGIQDSLKCWQQFQDSSSRMKHEAAQAWEQICASRARINQEAAQGLEDVLGER